jgi:ABC-type dipeptide/oligopeptide/nickel transport system permease subunit
MSQAKNPRLHQILELLTFNNETKLGFLLVLGIIIVSIVVAVGKTSVVPYNPIQQNTGPPLARPSMEHLFGTDITGRDV